jgi:hypothetical protein
VRISKTLGVAVIVVALTGLSMALAVSALGAKGPKSHDQGQSNGPLIRAALAPSMPAPTDPPIHGVNPGGVPWVLKRGDVRLKRDGTFNLRLKGLVIPNPPGDNTPGPVLTVSASLFCGVDTKAAATTEAVPISRSGNASIGTSLNTPDTCLSPMVLVHPNGILGTYISLTGFRP